MAERHTREPAHNGQVRVQSTDPEYTLSLIGLITAVCGQPIVGLVLSAIALKQSKKAGRYNLFGLLGLIFGIIFSSLFVLFFLFYIIIIVATVGSGHRF